MEKNGIAGAARAAKAQLLAFDKPAGASVELRVAQAQLEQLVFHFLFGLDVVRFLFAFDAKQGGLGDVDVPLAHQLVHLAIEEAQ